jgi:shikimate kinase
MVVSSIILIGPVRTGKTTLADQLGKALGLPRQSLDERRWTYYGEAGFDFAYNQKLEEEKRWNERRLYWSRHDPYAIRRFLQEYGEDHILDFGGSHSLHEEDTQLEEVKGILYPYPHVVLVLPCADPVESLRVLNERRGQPHLLYGFDLNERMLRHRTNYELAKHRIYTHGKTVEETSRELIALLKLTPI